MRAWLQRSSPLLVGMVAAGLAVLLVGGLLVGWRFVRPGAGASGAPAAAPRRTGVAPDVTVVAAGDISTTGENDSKRTSDLVLAAKPDGVLTLGDNQYPDGSLADFERYFAKSWGRFKSMIRPAPGHHEYYVDHTARGYYSYFGDAANNAGEPGCEARCKGYYSYDLGNWHLVALNTNHYETDVHPKQVCAFVGCDADSEQVSWLRDDLARTTQPCVLAYWSDPRWASGTRHGSNPVLGPIWDTLHAAHADVVVNGHEHYYERFAKQDPAGRPDPLGIREIIAGTGGNDLYPFGTPLATSEVRGNTSHGILRLRLRADSYTWRFVPAEGGFTDSGTATCNPKTPGGFRRPPGPGR